MERELFNWLEWDGDPNCMIFSDVTLNVQIGDFGPGAKFATATVEITLQGEGILRFHNEEGVEIAAFELHYTVGKRKK